MGHTACVYALVLTCFTLFGGGSNFLLQHDLDSLPIPEDAELPSEEYYDLQRVDHFTGSDVRYWKQRYFVNTAYYRQGGPVFLVLGDNSEANPAWIVNSAVSVYAAQHGAMMILLEHRYYGKSRPVDDLTTSNLKYLSSRQALADIARFISDSPQQFPRGAKVILFGKGYAGSLAAWFRAQYPYMVAGAITSAARMVALYDYQDFYVKVGEALDTAGAMCSANIMDATGRMYDWWGQADKRVMMENFFRLCHKIDHNSIIDVTVLFYDIAHYFANVVLSNNINKTRLVGSSINIQNVCDIMNDERAGDTIQRYGEVTKMLLDANKVPCLDIRYTTVEALLKQIDWNSTSAEIGRRQWMYQLCAEFGWAKTSWSRKQPFGLWFTFPWNYTMDKCDSAFKFLNVDENVQETNTYYGGLDITLSKVLFANGEMDPWRGIEVTAPLAHSPGADIIMIPGASHCADMYPPSPGDSSDLTKARRQISYIIGKYLTDGH